MSGEGSTKEFFGVMSVSCPDCGGRYTSYMCLKLTELDTHLKRPVLTFNNSGNTFFKFKYI